MTHYKLGLVCENSSTVPRSHMRPSGTKAAKPVSQPKKEALMNCHCLPNCPLVPTSMGSLGFPYGAQAWDASHMQGIPDQHRQPKTHQWHGPEWRIRHLSNWHIRDPPKRRTGHLPNQHIGDTPVWRIGHPPNWHIRNTPLYLHPLWWEPPPQVTSNCKTIAPSKIK